MNGTKAGGSGGGGGNGTGAFTGGIPLNVTLHSWPVPKLHAEQKQFNQTNAINARNSESAKNFTNRLHNLNATGYVAIDEDLTDTGFTDVQTLILAGVATLIPLFIGVAIILGIRYLWRRYRQRKGEGYEGVLQREESSEPLRKLEGRNLPLELKNSESQFNVNPGGDLTNGSSPQVLTPKSNGSVITMTLKNNHLIVETEETSDPLNGIKIETQGSTTKFVTQTARGFRASASSSKASAEGTTTTDHGALVHCPPQDLEEEPDRESCNTGLSQSDLSVSSTESQNPSYRYGNQTGYDSGGYGYPEYSGYAMTADATTPFPSTKGPSSHKAYYRSPSMIERSDSMTASSVPQGDRQSDVLRSDINARASRIKEAEEERYQEEQRALGVAEASPKTGEISVDTADGDKAKPGSSSDGGGGGGGSGKGSTRGSRCDQLKSEISPAEEVECFPGSKVNKAAESSVSS